MGFSEFFSDDSIERMYHVNRIRDLLRSASDQLEQLGVLKVLLFGSVHDGTANPRSDIDLCVIHTPLSESFIQYSDEFFHLQAELSAILRDSGLEVTFFSAKNQLNSTVIHINLLPNDQLDANGKPSYVNDYYELWTNSREA